MDRFGVDFNLICFDFERVGNKHWILFYLRHLSPWVGGIFEKLWQIATKHPRESLKIQANLSKTAYANQRGGGRAKRTKFWTFRTYFLIFARFERFGFFRAF